MKIIQICWLAFIFFPYVNAQDNANHFSGHFAGHNNLGNSNAFFGRWISYNTGNGGGTGSGNSIFGIQAGLNLTSGFSNSFFGNYAGKINQGGSENVFIGSRSGELNAIGSRNTFLGHSSGYSNVSGSDNIYIGVLSGYNKSSGDKNTCVGGESGTGTTGSNNTYIGYGAGLGIAGNNNIYLGYNAGPSGTSVSSKKLFIDITKSNTPLIYGEFDNDFVKINGSFEVTAGLTNPSDVNLKTNFHPIDHTEILDKVVQLPIQQWVFKRLPNEIHIGAVAQDFYNLFGTGKDDKHISTIDADGVALAAIQALKKENDELKEAIKLLAHKIEQIESKY